MISPFGPTGSSCLIPFPNLLPIPALDGGRLVFLIIEAIRRKPISQKYEIAINAAGFILLIGLMIFATFNDITKLIV